MLENPFPTLVRYIRIFFFISPSKDPEYRQLQSFDWWTPKYMSFHKIKEVTGWFKEAKLINIEITSKPNEDIGVKGVKK